jgi:protein-tyrosine kinase
MSIIEKAFDKLGLGEVDEKVIAEGVKKAEARESAQPLATLERIEVQLSQEPLSQTTIEREVETAAVPLPAVDVAPAPAIEAVQPLLVTEAEVSAPIPEETPVATGQAVTRRQLKLNLQRLREVGLLTPEMARTQMAEEYRIIKRPILNNAFGNVAHRPAHANLVMVASSVPGEGKTFTAINLAMSVAMELDRTVLLVDSDVLKPEVTRLMGIQAERGLTDVLLDPSIPLSDVLIRTDVHKLSILPAGRRHSHSNELMASEAMRDLAEELAARYPDRLVIFDSPPLLATTEAQIVAGLMGQIVLVVEAEHTLRAMVRETLSLFGDDKVVGLVLNKSRQITRNDFYGYGQYGQYGHSSAS